MLDTRPDDLTPTVLAAIRRKLLAWFVVNRRPMPWRATREAYPLWISEVMLQQTTVAAVIPYFERFLASFPDLMSLAHAEEAEVMRHWQGLGYYRRARHLHAAAKRLRDDHGATPPDDPEYWATLPGVGRYILGAVLSQAFEHRLPIVEANSLRVLSRWFGSRLDPREGDGKKWVWLAAEAVLPKTRIGDFNQAIMELGAVVCTPKNPKCETCPVRKHCRAKAEGIAELIPPMSKRHATTPVREMALVIRNGNTVLIGKRPDTASRGAGLWELPTVEMADGESPENAAARIGRELFGKKFELGAEFETQRYKVTRFEISITLWEAKVKSVPRKSNFYESLAWIDPLNRTEHAMSTPQRKLLDTVFAVERTKRLF